MMAPYRFFASVTRKSDLWKEPFDVNILPRQNWATGDFVVGRVAGTRNRLHQCETKTGRTVEMVRGDLLVGALGRRAATLEGVGDWCDIGPDLEMDALTSAGLFGKATSVSPLLPELMRLTYLGHAVRQGSKITMGGVVKPVPERKLKMPVILLIGTSMSAGKTSAGRVAIRALRHAGLKVVGAKLTGAARYRDILSFRDSGAGEIFDFVDVGLPSTVCEPAEFSSAMGQLLSQIQATDADVLVAEAGASPMEPYNGTIAMEMIRDATAFTILCASDPYAVIGVKEAFGIEPDLGSGPAANTTAAVELVRRFTGLPALNLLDRPSYSILKDMLVSRLDEAVGTGVAVAGER
jgi:hypothetical protein